MEIKMENFHTPHFPYSAFSTLLIFQPPHSHFPHPAFPTLHIFCTPHSALYTLRFPCIPPHQNGGWKLVGKNVHRKRHNFRRQPENKAFKLGKIAKISMLILFSFLRNHNYICLLWLLCIAMLTVLYKQVFWYSNFTNHRTKESFVSTANKPLASIVISVAFNIKSIQAMSFWPRSNHTHQILQGLRVR